MPNVCVSYPVWHSNNYVLEVDIRCLVVDSRLSPLGLRFSSCLRKHLEMKVVVVVVVVVVVMMMVVMMMAVIMMISHQLLHTNAAISS